MRIRSLVLIFITVLKSVFSNAFSSPHLTQRHASGCVTFGENSNSYGPRTAYSDDTQVSTLETAKLQFCRLFGETGGSMGQQERLLRIILSWSLLICAKSMALMSPLYFKALIEKSSQLTAATEAIGTLKTFFEKGFEASTIGIITGLGAAKVASGIVQLACEITLSPATTSAAETLPMESFAAALSTASRRQDDNAPKKNSSRKSGALAAAGGQDEGQSGFARRALDRGLKASNQFLYRSIFNLLPSFVETLCVLCLMWIQAGPYVGLTAALIAATFVSTTAFIMSARIPILRHQLQSEGIANGCAEDALSLAETVTAFGADGLERQRYARALTQVSKSALKVRFSFSILKLIQACILGIGSATMAYVSWRCAQANVLASFTGQLVLVQSLFAQLCAPLDHVGQHFRDCVSAAEDLRELEQLKRNSVDSTATLTRSAVWNRSSARADLNSPSLGGVDHELPLARLDKQVGGRQKWANSPHRLEIRELSFRYFTAADRDISTAAQPRDDTSPVTSRGSVVTRARPLLQNISLVIPSGGYSIGLVGPSGSGKSTLLRVLVGLEQIVGSPTLSETNHTGHSSILGSAPFQSQGTILIDGTDVSSSLRSQYFAMVGQENDLFRSLSLAENVRYGTHSVLAGVGANDSPEALEAFANAASDAKLGLVVKRLKGGWEGMVGPRGRFLSGGERQRVCIARGLYREELGAGILLMDEVTSSLDAKTESSVMEAIMARVKAGSTAILIAHRLSSVQQCDLILVMKDGAIVESGKHEHLIRKRGGWYAEAWNLQSKSLAS